jgi:hypothetical protein
MVTGMTSSEGEYIDFKQPISAEGIQRNFTPISILVSSNPRVITPYIILLKTKQTNNIQIIRITITTGMVETWMTNVEAEMRRTLRTIAKEAVFYYPKTPRIKWILQFPGTLTSHNYKKNSNHIAT